MTNEMQNANNNGNYEIDDEIDLGYLLDVIKRNKYLIASISFLSFLVLVIYAICKPKVWQGSFQIVLEQNNNQPLSNFAQKADAANLMNTVTGKFTSASTRTEVGILESPSVLKPVFDYVNEENKKSKPGSKDLIFSYWKRDKLQIKLKDGTSILNIAYFDKDRKKIIPVLTKISKEYQKYSGKRKARKLKLTKSYLQKQISEYQIKSYSSIKKAQEYAISEDLFIPSINNSNSQNNINRINRSNTSNTRIANLRITSPNTTIEQLRINAANKLREINVQIKTINEIKNKSDKLLYIRSEIVGLNNLFESLDLVDQNILIFNTKYYPNSSLRKLNFERDILIKSIEKRAIELLNARKVATEIEIKEAIRPKEIISKYSELMREANRDEITLVQLENSLREVFLEEAKLEDPWQLITNPTLDNKPIALSKRIAGLMGLLFGTIFGLIYSLIKERKSGYIYQNKFLEKILKSEIIYELDLQNKKSIGSCIDFMDNLLKVNSLKNIRFISLSLDKATLTNLNKEIFNKNNFLFSSEKIIPGEKNDMVIFITKYKIEKFKVLEDFHNKLNLLNNKVNGILFLK